MQKARMQQLTRLKQRPANDNWPRRSAESTDRQARRTGQLALLVFGLLSLTIVSCLLAHRAEKWIRFCGYTMLSFKKKASDRSRKRKSTFVSDALGISAVEVFLPWT
jgi:hypothetical protein